MMLLLLLLLAGPVRPNPVYTPGAVRDLSKQQICSIKWGLDRRHVTVAMRRQVFKNYGIPWANRSRYETDHFLPRELGGADAVANLWPQSYDGEYGARKKDFLENRLKVLMCRGQMSLEFARHAITSDWVAAYRLYVLAPKRPH